MSRSYKHTPIFKVASADFRRFSKRDANKMVRRTKYIPNGKAYRKVYSPWDIYDYVIYGRLQRYLHHPYSMLGPYHWDMERFEWHLKQCTVQHWKKTFYRK